MEHGPSSKISPVVDEQPGPPFSLYRTRRQGAELRGMDRAHD